VIHFQSLLRDVKKPTIDNHLIQEILKGNEVLDLTNFLLRANANF